MKRIHKLLHWSFALLVLLSLSVAHADTMASDTPLARELEVVDGTQKFPKKTFLQYSRLRMVYWIDNRSILVELITEKLDGETTSKVAVVDTETGTTNIVWPSGRPSCYSEGQVEIYDPQYYRNKRYYYFLGKLGGALLGYENSPKGKMISRFDCTLENIIPPVAEDQFDHYAYGIYSQKRLPLKAKHGHLVYWTHRYSQYEDFTATKLYLQKPTGEKIDIPIELGEELISADSYVPFEDAYLLRFVWKTDTPGKDQYSIANPKLLYPATGEMKQLSVPKMIERKVRSQEIRSGIIGYTKLGLLWMAEILPSSEKIRTRSQPDEYEYYLDTGNQLLKVEGEYPSPDGCKLIGKAPTPDSTHYHAIFHRYPKYDYFVTNLCEGK